MKPWTRSTVKHNKVQIWHHDFHPPVMRSAIVCFWKNKNRHSCS